MRLKVISCGPLVKHFLAIGDNVSRAVLSAVPFPKRNMKVEML